jgi:D-cysteine desulfhydrase
VPEHVPSARRAPLLFDAFPALARTLAWEPLASLPTPVERCSAIAEWLGRDDIWMKRDDLASPLYGGNKVRRYELVLAEARALGRTRLVTAGGLASTQVMATALFGRQQGLAVRAVLYDQPITAFAKRQLLGFASTGAELIWGGGYVSTTLRTLDALARGGRRENYLILPGASGPIANLGYVDAMLELAGQVERGELPRPDAIVLPTGSSGTLAALALGAAWLGWETEIVGVRIAPWIATNRATIGAVIRATDRFVHARDPQRWKRQSGRARFSLHHGAIGPGYGHPTAEAIAALPLVEALTGASGEVTYSAKALTGLRSIAAEPRWKGKTLLLWNTLSSVTPPIASDARERLPPSLRALLDAAEVA